MRNGVWCETCSSRGGAERYVTVEYALQFHLRTRSLDPKWVHVLTLAMADITSSGTMTQAATEREQYQRKRKQSTD